MRILVADDDGTSRIMLKSMVTRLGHDCLVVEDGANAWEILSSQEVDVLLTDWMMPGVDGPELCRRVRSGRGDRYVYIVLTTGLDHQKHVLEGMSAGADDYLTKPVDSFAVQTRLVAAARVTELHQQLALTQAKLEQANVELLDQSLTDELTSLGNRRRMEEDISDAHTQATRYGKPYGVALFDVDHFKLYNDFYGHQAGDECLQRVAETMQRTSRAGERAYRYGGEEFLLLVPDCRQADSIVVTAERVRRAVADLGIPHEARPSDPTLVTLSGGVACWLPGSSVRAQDVIEEADAALYEAKSTGRNQIHAWSFGEVNAPAVAPS